MKCITLSRGAFTLVDDEDYEEFGAYNWSLSTGKGLRYAKRWAAAGSPFSRGASVALHRVIMRTPGDMVVDHIDGDGLNNQKFNLRNCSRSQNNANRHSAATNKFYGVYFNIVHRKWVAQLNAGGRKIFVGFFHDVEVAARARDAAAIKHQGTFARLNFPAENQP